MNKKTTISLQLREEDKQQLAEKAKQLNISLSEYVRIRATFNHKQFDEFG